MNTNQKQQYCLPWLISIAFVLVLMLLTQAIKTNAVEPDLQHNEKFQADRKAILAMAGEYQVKFRFRETMGFSKDYKLHKSHLSQAKELVVVAEDTGKHIALQHILVLETGRIVKHWCQQWNYEDHIIYDYKGNDRWEPRILNQDAVKGTWTQAVSQTDDSPRYEGIGRWIHTEGYSRWESNHTWRPLPRREYKTRSDYQVLISRHRHTITPQGWIHEQDSEKLVLDSPTPHIIARELGFNTYTKITGGDFSPGKSYWNHTAPFWAQVRSAWNKQYNQQKPILITDGVKLNRSIHDIAADVKQNGINEVKVLTHQTTQLINSHIKH